MRVVGVTPDQEKGAGYALLELDEAVRDAQIELAFYDIDHGYLWPSSLVRTTWRTEPYYFKVSRVGDQRPILRLGPKICNYLAPDSLIDIRSRDSDIVQGLAWIGVPLLVMGEDDSEVVELPSPSQPATPSPTTSRLSVRLSALTPPKENTDPHKSEPQSPPGDAPWFIAEADPVPAVSSTAKSSRTKRWLTGSIATLAMFGGIFVWALSHGLDWQVNASDPIQFEKTATGYSPNEVHVQIKRAWWAAWIDHVVDPRIELVAGDPVYASNYQPGTLRIIDLQLRLPTDVRETDISFWHPATNIVFGRRRVSIRPMPGGMAVAAADDLKFSGPKGGPFSPASVRLTISSQVAGFLWSVVAKPDWLNVSPDSDFISADKSQDIQLTTSAPAAAKEVGSYSDTLIIKSPTSEFRKAVVLVVGAAGPPVDVAAQCDAMAGSRFDIDRPGTTPIIDNMLLSSDGDVDTAIAACAAAASTKGGRRFYAQLGRAYAAKAEKQAIGGNDDAARATMELALSAWRTAVSQGSGSAMNFLGAYYLGTYNDEVAPGRAAASLMPFTFNSPNRDTALKSFQDAANNANVNGMRNAGSLLLGDTDPPPSFQSIPEGVRWLKKAVSAGDTRAAVVLGKAFYTGSPKDVVRYADASPPAREQALQLLGKACANSVDPSAKSSAKEFFDKVTSRTYAGSGGKLEPSRRPAECS